MKMLLVTGLVGMLSGCAGATPSGHWEQAGRTEMESRDDHAHCEKVAMQESLRNKSDEPFKEAAVLRNCMERMGYTYIKNPK